MEDIVDCCLGGCGDSCEVESGGVRELQMVVVAAVRDYYELQPRPPSVIAPQD